jgi:hypothetical protein
MIRVKSRYLAICVVVLSVGGIGCAQDGAGPAVARTQTPDLKILDKSIPKLEPGSSTEDVRAKIGAPIEESTLEDGEVSLSYGNGLWQLFFDPDLVASTRHYRAGYWPSGRNVAPLDREVRGLKARSSMAEVKRQFGEPESWVIEIPGEKESLWYGPGRWKLMFSDDMLLRKVLYIGGSPARDGGD